MSVVRLLLAAALMVPAPAAAARLTGVGVIPSPFGFGPLTVAATFHTGAQGKATRGADATTGPARYRVQIEDNVSSRPWTSDWMPVPEGAGTAKTAAAVTAWYQPDTAIAARITEIIVSAFLDDGAGHLTVRRANYFRWLDEQFHRTPDYGSVQRSDWRPEVPAADPFLAAPPELFEVLVAEPVIVDERPVETTSWARVKHRYVGREQLRRLAEAKAGETRR